VGNAAKGSGALEYGRSLMTQMLDPTFYRSPGEAIAAPPEQLAYVAAYDRAGKAKDAMAVIDVDASSASYGQVVGWSDSAGTPAPAPCATRVMASMVSRWSGAT
jgi:hypothetical protein